MGTSARTLSVSILAAAAVLATFAFIVPVAASVANPVAAHWRTAVSIFIFASYLGAALSLLIGVKSFKPELRSAYRFLAAGLIGLSAIFIQLVIWGLFDLWDSAWAASGSGLFPFLLACLLAYLGVRKFARLIGVKSLVASFWLVTAITVVAGTLVYLLAMHFVQYKLQDVEIYIAVCALCGGYFFFTGALLFKIQQAIGAYYKGAMRSLGIAFTGLGVAAAHEAINTFWFNNGDTYTDYGYYLIPFVIVGVLFIRAAYAFLLLPATKAAPASAITEAPAGDALRADYIDSIVAVAAIVSRARDLDPVLDDLRFVTASNEPNAGLNQDDKQRLLKVYNNVETYLTTKDALRTYTKEEVRSHVTPAFRTELTK